MIDTEDENNNKKLVMNADYKSLPSVNALEKDGDLELVRISNLSCR